MLGRAQVQVKLQGMLCTLLLQGQSAVEQGVESLARYPSEICLARAGLMLEGGLPNRKARSKAEGEGEGTGSGHATFVDKAKPRVSAHSLRLSIYSRS